MVAALRAAAAELPAAEAAQAEGADGMTALPPPSAKKLGLVIDLDTCVGCQACVVACKGWNTENYGAPLSDLDPYGAEPEGTFLNRVHTYEAVPRGRPAADRPLPPLVPALRGRALRHRLPHRRQLEAGRGRHRAGQRGRLHGLRPLRLGLPLRRARDGRGRGRDEEVHALRRPHRQPQPARGGPRPRLRPHLPPGARHFGDLGDPESAVSLLVARAGRRGPDARAGHAARQQVPAPPPQGPPRRGPGAGARRRTARRGFLGWLDRALARLPGV